MTYVMSDIHGHFDKYQKMLRKIGFSGQDTLYVLGDVIDRGPDGVRILQDMSVRFNVVPILGNHEFTAAVCLNFLLEEITDESIAALRGEQIAALSAWLTDGGAVTLQGLRRLQREERQAVLEYLREMELYAEVEAGGKAFLLVHAGLDNFAPDRPLQDYELTDYLFARPKADTVYYPDKTVVLGHTPTRLLCGQDRVFFGQNMIDIDCGCGFDGPLACLCLETMETFYA